MCFAARLVAKPTRYGVSGARFAHFPILHRNRLFFCTRTAPHAHSALLAPVGPHLAPSRSSNVEVSVGASVASAFSSVGTAAGQGGGVLVGDTGASSSTATKPHREVRWQENQSDSDKCNELVAEARASAAAADLENKKHKLKAWREKVGAHDPGTQVTLLGAASNVFLCSVKGATGVLAHSPALIADAVHSLSDLLSDALTLVALRMGKKGPDAAYPFGYGKYEQLGSLGVSGLICATAIGIGKESVTAALHPAAWELSPDLAPYAISVCLLSVGMKELLYRLTMRVGQETQSCVLIANAWHHRSDAWSSIVAAFGIAGSYMGMPFLDPAAGCIVALGVFKVGAEMGYTSVVELADRHDNDIEKEVMAATEGFDLHVSRVRVRKAGPRAFIHLHVMLHPRISVSAAEHAGAKLKQSIKQRVPEVEEVWIKWSCEIPSVLSRVTDLQSEIRGIVSTVPDVLLCSHVHCHFLHPTELAARGDDADIPQVVAEVGIVSSLRTISDLRMQTHVVRNLVIESMKRSQTCNCDCVNVIDVEVKVDLNDGCQFIQIPDASMTTPFKSSRPCQV
eukprot:GEMP01012585.1.p1 GENE.GEMP01012585.1~~GEMP01012585.1.p1  ORF type:complete len:567 (+),score=114.15 GEMP01012585.1:304-2004(+)